MGKIMLGIIFGGLALFAYQRAQHPDAMPVAQAEEAEEEELPAVENDGPQFRCDGRTHCSQMTSCAEAEYFLQNCPGVKMDGEGDGVPCEKQWCGSN